MTDFRGDASGVSTVIGAILVAAMVATVFAHVQLHHAPVWEARAEARHTQELQARLAGFQTALVSASGVGAGAAATLGLAPDGSILAGGSSSSHAVSFRHAAAPLQLELDQFVQPNATLEDVSSAWSEDWVDEANQIEDVDKVFNFRLRIEEIGGSKYGHVRVVAKDASGRYAGNFTILQEPDPPNTNVFIRTTDRHGTVLYDNPVAIHLANKISPYWVDVLNSEYRYQGILATAAKPIAFNIEQVYLSAEHTISYSTTQTDGSTEVVGGAGEPVEVDLSFAAGALEHQANRAQLVPQRWVLEHGALILAQHDGAIFQIPPPFDARTRAGTFHLDMVLPVLEGDSTSVTGSSSALLDARGIHAQEWTGMSSRFSLNLTTAFPLLWANLFTERLQAAGAPAANHTVTAGSDWVRLEIGGPSSDPNTPDLSMNIRIPRYQLTLGG